jgi:hypothetical protein
VATRKDRLNSTLLSIVKETTGRTKLLAFILKELDSERCVGEQRQRYQKAFDKLTSKDYESVRLPSPTKELNEKPIEDEPDPFS